MKLVYLTTLEYPSTFANRIQVMKMSEVLAGMTDFTLYVSRVRSSLPELFSFYGVRNHFLIKELNFSQKKPRAIRAAWQLRSIIDESPHDSIFYIREALPAFFLIFFSRRFRQNFFYEAHSFVRHSRLIYKTVFAHARGIITTTESKRHVFIKKFHIPDKKILVARNAIDFFDFSEMIDRISARSRLDLPPASFIVAFTGKPIEREGIDTLLEIAEKSPSHWYFLAVGGSDAEIAVLKVRPGASRIHFIPQVAHDRVPLYLSAANVVIAPQTAKHVDVSIYSSPLKVLEYLASKTPAVLSDIPAIREIADDRVATFAHADNAADFIEKIKKIESNPKEMEHMAFAGYKHAMGQNWKARAEKIVNFMSGD
jgi:glycosyltransferase involved in cell wall biosynthesis